MKELVLGLVVTQPGGHGYGYKWAQRIDREFSFLELSDQYVYSALRALEREGLVEKADARTAAEHRTGTPRVPYRPTPRGEEAFRAWLAEPLKLSIERTILVLSVKLMLVDDADRDVMQRLVDALYELAERVVAELDAMRRAPAQDSIDIAAAWSTICAPIVDDARASVLQALRGWIERTVEILEQRLGHLAAAET